MRIDELTFTWRSIAPRISPCGEVLPGRVELLDSVVPQIRDDEIPRRIDSKILRLLELAVDRAFRAPFGQELPRSVELLNSVVAGV